MVHNIKNKEVRGVNKSEPAICILGPCGKWHEYLAI